MSFLKITDPTKRDQTVKEYLLAERTGEQQLQTELTKFYRPITESQKATAKEITESQKATAREITEGLRPIREGIESLPKAMQPTGEASAKAPEEEEEEEEDESIGPIARKYLNKPNTDKTFGVRKEGDHHYIGKKHIIITKDSDIIIKESGDKFFGTVGLWGLITSKDPDKELIDWDKHDIRDYERLMIKTNALHRDNNPKNPYPKGSKSGKWKMVLGPIWENRKKFEGKGVVIMSSDPNALLTRFDLLRASKKAGHTNVVNEMVSICDELKRQGVLDTKSYKNFNSIIKNDST